LRERNRELAVLARRSICARLGVHPPAPEQMLGAMATIPLPARFNGRLRQGKIDPEQLRLYDEFGIEVPWSRFGNAEQRWFRISAQAYNCLAEYEYLADAILTLE